MNDPDCALPRSFYQVLGFCRESGFRMPVLVEGDEDWTLEWVKTCLQSLHSDESAYSPIHNVLWFSTRAPESAWVLKANRIQHELGRESRHVVFDLYDGFNVDALAAISGTLKQGGCLFILCPPLSKWSSFADPFEKQLYVAPWTRADVRKLFLTRCARLFQEATTVTRIRQDEPFCFPVPDQLKHTSGIQSGLAETEFSPFDTRRDDFGCASASQRAAVAAILSSAQGHRNRPLVLLADRGRGKSAALGIAARELLAKNKRIVVTAPRPQAVETVLRFASNQAPSDQSLSSQIRFVAPDALLEQLQRQKGKQTDIDLLMVDEAAAIAPALLKAVLQLHSRVVMATTVNGYEGTGAGFRIRFTHYLDQQFPGWKSLLLDEPVRWRQGDWLETLLQGVLMPMTAYSEPSGKVQEPDTNATEESLAKTKAKCITGFEGVSLYEPDFSLKEEEGTLRQVFELLALAHYRTRPSDLRMLMDSANLRCLVTKLPDSNSILAVALIAEEGRIPDTLARAILEGKRRPKGQVLPQSVAVHLGLEDTLVWRSWRVVRIAVEPQLQFQGAGSHCLSLLKEQAQAEGVMLFGSLFSATAPLLAFWQRNGFSLLRMGYTRESTSGGYSALVAIPLGEHAEQALLKLNARVTADLPQQLRDTHRNLPVSMVMQILSMTLNQPWDGSSHQGVTQQAHAVANREWDQQQLNAYLSGYKVYETVSASLERWIWWLLQQHRAPALAQMEDIVILKLVQNRSWPEVVDVTGSSGQKQARAGLRSALDRLANIAPSTE